LNRQKQIVGFLQENQIGNIEDDMFVTITLYRVPASLLREFTLRVAVHHPGGISEAIQDLMRNAIKG
jgi:hypothetical protein